MDEYTWIARDVYLFPRSDFDRVSRNVDLDAG